MDREKLTQHIKERRSFLCVGLDPDIQKIPPHLVRTPLPFYEFCREIIDATAPFCAAYKLNLAFFEAYGIKGMEQMQMVVKYIRVKYPAHFTIADAKRGDIGNTSEQYAVAYLDHLDFDAITVAPYMGKDSVTPFMREGKWVVVLVLTSNPGADDFQLMKMENGKSLFLNVAEKIQSWGTPDNLMIVAGATRPEALSEIREVLPMHFFLVPGIGAQGGSLIASCRHGLNMHVGLLVNMSRDIIYASPDRDFAKHAGIEAHKVQQEMEDILMRTGLIN